MKDDKRSGITPIMYPTYNVRDAISELSRTKLKSSEFISEHNDGALGYQVGYMLGETKASLDLLPQDVAHEQTLNDIKLDLWIRFQVNEFVTNKLMSIFEHYLWKLLRPRIQFEGFGNLFSKRNPQVRFWIYCWLQQQVPRTCRICRHHHNCYQCPYSRCLEKLGLLFKPIPVSVSP